MFFSGSLKKKKKKKIKLGLGIMDSQLPVPKAGTLPLESSPVHFALVNGDVVEPGFLLPVSASK
jgi:hypothetical protein